MLIDWVTIRLASDHIPREQWQRLKKMGDRIARFSASTGEVVYETQAWDSIRSDSHQISCRLGSDAFWIQGSPARIVGDGCAVFGSGVSSDLDLLGCVEAMKNFVSRQLGELFPRATYWKVSRVDVTGNILLPSLNDVRKALSVLRNCEGGRYRVSQQAGDTVYWSQRSRLRKGKAYAKGPHLRYMMKKKDYTGCLYSEYEIEKADRLLRLELTIASQWWRERTDKPWQDFTKNDLLNEWNNYFSKMIGDSEMKTESDLKTKLHELTTEGRAKAAYGCFLLIQSEGWEQARESFSKPTWYRHLKLLRQAGLGDADLSAGKIVQFRQKIIECQIVNSWSELEAA